MLLTAATERLDEEEETAKERERERESFSSLDIRGFLVTEIIVLQTLLKGKVAIEMSIMAELSSAQVTECT